MISSFTYKQKDYKADLSRPLDISIPLISGADGPNCFYAPKYESTPVKTENFIGDTLQGGLVNFFNIKINPHGNGTHTECVGHIADKRYFLNDCLRKYHFLCQVISVTPSILDNGDRIIEKDQIAKAMESKVWPEAIAIRTLPNDEEKKKKIYSGTNPTYFHHEAISFLINNGIDHLLTDQPSVDREEDGGKLIGHKTFWGYPEKIIEHRSITELIFVPNKIKDGLYLLHLMVGAYQLDVSPSKPTLYELL